MSHPHASPYFADNLRAMLTARLDKAFSQYPTIPETMAEGIRLYVLDGVPPGDFLSAVINNNLKEACGRADENNLTLLPTYVRLFYNYVPLTAWGNPDSVHTYCQLHATARAEAIATRRATTPGGQTDE